MGEIGEKVKHRHEWVLVKLKIPMERIPGFVSDLMNLADGHGATVCRPFFGHIDALVADFDHLLVDYAKGSKIKIEKDPSKG